MTKVRERDAEVRNSTENLSLKKQSDHVVSGCLSHAN